MRTIILAFLLAFGSVSAAYAHAHVESSEPADGQVITSSPDSLKITFSEPLRPGESHAYVYDAHKKQVSGLTITKTGNDDILSYALPKLAPGIYTVKWKAVCLCTDHHATNGSFKFTVKG
jgi:methionine-rich copper-binding protein CopC